MQACTKTHHFEIKNANIFWGGGGHLLPRPHSLRRLGGLNLHAYGSQAQRDPPKNILVTALMHITVNMSIFDAKLLFSETDCWAAT